MQGSAHGSPSSLATTDPSDQRPPDFAMAYAFIGSIFDPKCSGIPHEDVMAQMRVADRRAVLQLVRNLAANLTRPEVVSQVKVGCSTAHARLALLLVCFAACLLAWCGHPLAWCSAASWQHCDYP